MTKNQGRLWFLVCSTWLLGALLVGIANQTPTSAAASFVTRSGASFMLNGKPYRFGGTNNYYLTYKSKAMVDNVLTSAANANFSVMRIWGFLDIGNQDGSNSVDGSGKKDSVYFQYWNGTAPAYNDGADGLQRLDYVVYKASQLGLRLTIALTNDWKDFGGMDQYVRWRGGQYHDQFYTDATIQQWYKNYVAHLVNRVNSYSGIAYKNDPAIFAWELANEPRCEGSGVYPRSSSCNASVLTNWATQMSSYIKSIDSNHLVAVGDEGFYCNTAGGSDWTENCGSGVDSVGLTSISSIDFMTVHLYPDHWSKTPDWGTTWITRHIADAKTVGKPIVIEEFGLQNQAQRDAYYKTWTDAVINNGGSGFMFWMLAGRQDDGSNYPDYDGFTIYCPSAFCTTLTNAAIKIGGAVDPTPTVNPTGNDTPPPTTTPAVTPTTTVPPTTTPPTTVPPTTTAPPTTVVPGLYAVRYNVQSQWGSGYNLAIEVVNNGGNAVNGWTISWSLPTSETIASNWSAVCSRSGTTITCSNMPYNATLAANGGSANFGMQINSPGGVATKPTAYIVNGVVVGVTTTTPPPTTPIPPTTTVPPTTTAPPTTPVTTVPPTTVAPGLYTVRYTIPSQWGSGYNLAVDVINNSSSAVNGWTISWQLPTSEVIANYWNADCSRSGTTVTCTNLNYNGTLAANGGAANFGMQINSSTGSATKPTSFILNGVTISNN